MGQIIITGFLWTVYGNRIESSDLKPRKPHFISFLSFANNNKSSKKINVNMLNAICKRNTIRFYCRIKMIDSIWISRSQIIIQVCWIKRSWFACHVIVIHFCTSQHMVEFFALLSKRLRMTEEKKNGFHSQLVLVDDDTANEHLIPCVFLHICSRLWHIFMDRMEFLDFHWPKWINALCMKRWAFNQL